MTYRDRRAARVERLRGWADKRETKADAAHAQADAMASVIPFGQPILVGHHSEGRDRRYRDKITGAMVRGIEHDRKASSMRSRADNIEAAAANAIYSDDEDAVERLTEKVARLEAERARIVAYNKTCRKGTPDVSVLDARQRAQVVQLAGLRGCGLRADGSFPTYATSNLGGQISTGRKRLATLVASQQRGSV